MRISVIIPVYNAENFIHRAVESALDQPETSEVVLVEDGSPDNSLRICEALAENEDRVRLYRHAEGSNRGAGPTRNLGVQRARQEWIAFLDADDYFLPGRFETAGPLLLKTPQADGVYESIGMHYYSGSAKQKWIAKEGAALTGLAKSVHPDLLFETLVHGGNGYIHLDGLLVRREAILASGFFPTNLRLHQDTAFIYQLAACAHLIPGRRDTPVALRGIHEHNRILAPYNAAYTRYLMWQHMLFWALSKPIGNRRKMLILSKWMRSLSRLCKAKVLQRDAVAAD